MEKKSEYKDLKFKSKQAFEEWLSETTYKTIHFTNKGQDLLKIWIAKNGEILHANMQALIWNGRFVNIETLAVNTNLCLWSNEMKKWNEMNFEIASIK